MRKVTWWTRKEAELPDLTDSEDEEDPDSEPSEKAEYSPDSGCKYYFLKYVCGVDHNKVIKKMTKEEKIAQRKAISDISENPDYITFMNVNAVLCAAACVFLHAFWA